MPRYSVPSMLAVPLTTLATLIFVISSADHELKFQAPSGTALTLAAASPGPRVDAQAAQPRRTARRRARHRDKGAL